MKQKGLIPIVIILLIAILVVGGYLIYKLPRTGVTPSTPQPTQLTSVLIPKNESTNSAEITNWKTYTNNTYKYSFKYPETWQIEPYFTDKEVWIVNVNDKSKRHYSISLRFSEVAPGITPIATKTTINNIEAYVHLNSDEETSTNDDYFFKIGENKYIGFSFPVKIQLSDKITQATNIETAKNILKTFKLN